MMNTIKTIILIAILVLIVHSLSGVVVINDLACLFNNESEKVIVETNVIKGASNFLLSKSSADLFLMEYEKACLQEMNFDNSAGYIENAILYLELAKEKYIQAKDTGERLGYIQTKVPWFENFNYDVFISANKLNTDISAKVKSFLSKADVIGIYKENLSYIDKILDTLYSIKKQLDDKKKPAKQEIWTLMQQYSEATLFGNYSTVMGQTILDNCDAGSAQ